MDGGALVKSLNLLNTCPWSLGWLTPILQIGFPFAPGILSQGILSFNQTPKHSLLLPASVASSFRELWFSMSWATAKSEKFFLQKLLFLKQNDKTKKQLGLEGASGVNLIHLSCSKQDHPEQVAQGCVQGVLNISKDEGATASLGNLCRCLTTLNVTNLFGGNKANPWA